MNSGDEEEDGGCGPCRRGGGLLLLALGLGLAWMGADLLSGGALTRLASGGLPPGAAAGAAAGTGDNGGAEVIGDDGEPG